MTGSPAQVVVFWFLVVALLLASTGEQEYRVAYREGNQSNVSCNCPGLNTTTNATCVPEEFKKFHCSTLCPGVVCQFVKYTKNQDYSLYSFCNLFGLYW